MAVKVGSPSKEGTAVPGNLQEMQILRPHPRLPKSEAYEGGASNLGFNEAPITFWHRPGCETCHPKQLMKTCPGTLTPRWARDGWLVGVDVKLCGRFCVWGLVQPESCLMARQE